MAAHRFLAAALSLLSLTNAAALHNDLPRPEIILNEALDALGGEHAIKKLTGVTYQAPNIFRSRSLMQSYDFNRADIAVAISGSQNISFDLSSTELEQRIDRRFVPSDYWTWGSPKLDPFDFSVVVRGGGDGFACYVKGNDQIWLPTDIASGYADSALADYLVLHGEMLSPHLLLNLKKSHHLSSLYVDINGIRMLAICDSSRDITVIMHAKTRIPYIVRTWEDHPVYGESTSDLYLTGYKSVHGILFPHSIQTVYNATSQPLNAPLEDFIVEKILINPKFPPDFFDGIPEEESFSPKSPPKQLHNISRAIVGEFNANTLGSGLKTTTVNDLMVDTPVDNLPFVHWLRFDNDTLGVKQMIIEFDTEVFICDAPPQWSKIVIQWVKENLNKPITHVWPTHHHRDHTGGVFDYVAIGAKLIVPEMAVPYWSTIPNVTFATFNESHPFIYRDNNIQAWFMWQEQATHSSDWTYAVITDRCPNDNSSVIALEADAWQAGVNPGQSDQSLMRQWLDQVLTDGLTDKAIVFPTHGLVSPLADLIELTGYPYPSLDVMDWQHGKASCH